jgi:hypothetical protein
MGIERTATPSYGIGLVGDKFWMASKIVHNRLTGARKPRQISSNSSWHESWDDHGAQTSEAWEA